MTSDTFQNDLNIMLSMLSSFRQVGNFDLVERLQESGKKLMFVGYGSLMYSNGLKNRGMDCMYSPVDIHEGIVKGFSRTFCENINLNTFSGKERLIGAGTEVAFYGAYRKKDAWFNCTAVEIKSTCDLLALLVNEGALIRPESSLYYPLMLDESEYVFKGISSKMEVLLLLTTYPRFDLRPNVAYVKRIIDGLIAERSDNFLENFETTAGFDECFPSKRDMIAINNMIKEMFSSRGLRRKRLY